MKKRLFITTMLTVFVAATGVIFFLGKGNANAAVVVEHCAHTLEANNDPIVFPGVLGASHLHEFNGNPTVDENSTPTSLSTSAQTTCDIAGDFSAYWSPAIFMDGVKVKAVQVGPYWRNLGVKVVAPPFGMEFVARGWGTNVAFACTSGGFFTSPPDCTGKGKVKMIVNFPSCWNGLGTDPTSFAYAAGKLCPSGFNIHIAALNLHVDTPIVNGAGHVFTCALLPDGTQGLISTFHADFMDAFDGATMQSIVSRLNA